MNPNGTVFHEDEQSNSVLRWHFTTFAFEDFFLVQSTICRFSRASPKREHVCILRTLINVNTKVSNDIFSKN